MGTDKTSLFSKESTSQYSTPTRKNIKYPFNILTGEKMWEHIEDIQDSPEVILEVVEQTSGEPRKLIEEYYEQKISPSIIASNRGISRGAVAVKLSKISGWVSDMILNKLYGVTKSRSCAFWVSMGLDIRSASCLARTGLCSFESVMEFCECSEKGLLNIRNLGEVSARTIMDVFKQHGYIIEPCKSRR